MAVLSHKSLGIKRELYKPLSLQNMCVPEVCREAGSWQTEISLADKEIASEGQPSVMLFRLHTATTRKGALCLLR